jgi:CRISPR system Cascade subunit CasE
MYLSVLMIDVGDNPDRPRPGRQWLRNIYHVHQRLSMAFPANARKTKDPHFLRPYQPQDFPLHNLGPHVSRNEQTGFLFRIDPRPGNHPIIRVQSSIKPDWDYAFKNARHLLAADPECKEYNPHFQEGESWRFRILINLSHKAKCTHDKQINLTRVQNNVLDSFGRPKSQSKRVALTWNENQNPEEVILDWFQRKANVRLLPSNQVVNAFSLIRGKVLHLGWVMGWKKNHAADQPADHPIKLRSALIEGELQVINPQAFHRLVAGGIGAAKAFGFGLLSLAPMQPMPTSPQSKPFLHGKE